MATDFLRRNLSAPAPATLSVPASAAAASVQDELPVPGATEWQGPWAASRRRRDRRWRTLLWALLFPPRGHRIAPTLTGVLLIAVSLGIGTAAYNTANNILFITLSLLLSCLVLSGVMSWLNLRGVAWRVHAAGPWRAGQTQLVALELRNTKTLLPTYGLWFDLAVGETTERRHLGMRLDPGASTRLEWPVKAARRGVLRVELRAIGSLFPFGFLHKSIASRLAREVLVWPAPVDYRRHLGGQVWRMTISQGEINRPGHGGDLLALRRYVPGDSPRLVHWKASARLRQILVRQFSAEGMEGFLIHVDPDAALWPRPEQFELALALAATLAEDLFKMERLHAVQIDAEPPQTVRRLRDVELFLDRLALLEPVERPSPTTPEIPRSGFAASSRVLRIQPQGLRGVAALLDGTPAASA
jgi:Uncharacterized conserved protein (some members contain a von Willebrand factor type A (vWA) domain)